MAVYDITQSIPNKIRKGELHDERIYNTNECRKKRYRNKGN